MRYTIERIESGNFAGLYVIRISDRVGTLIGSWEAMLDIATKIEQGFIK